MYHYVLSKSLDDWPFVLQWVLQSLSKHGTERQSPQIAVRVFCWGLQHASTPKQWDSWLPIIRKSVPAQVYKMMVDNFDIESPGKIDPNAPVPSLPKLNKEDNGDDEETDESSSKDDVAIGGGKRRGILSFARRLKERAKVRCLFCFFSLNVFSPTSKRPNLVWRQSVKRAYMPPCPLERRNPTSRRLLNCTPSNASIARWAGRL